jgi:hypothetical protein
MLSSLLLVNCTKHSFDGYNYETKAKEDFAQRFVKTFGEPASDQDWGFDGVSIVDLTSKASTRGHNVNRNEWANNFVVPANVTANERDLVVAEFSKERVGATNTENVNWTDYFIYEVYKGTDVYPDGNGKDVLGSDHMNHLQVKKAEGDLLPPDNACWEHANDFNNGNSTGNWQSIEGATLMLNSGTLDFAYHNSTDSKYHMEYIIIPGEKIDQSLAGFYYVGFDFYATHPEGQEANKNMDVERNWVFNDWIVRISPATFKASKRIIAEDLAADEGSDFDYNDVVFDATLANEWIGSLNANKLVAHITLRAAGGTMPLYVADKEVHELFGVDTGTMVNTGRVSRPAVQFTAIIGEADWNNTKSIKDIPVRVLTNNGEITLQSNKGEASEKLCVDKTYVWCSERQPIQNKYPDFVRFVSDRNVKWYQVQ